MNIENCYFSNNIDCCGNEADYELEEGEIVDTDDDEVVQGIDRKPEPEQYEKNRICVYNERSAKRVIYIIIINN